jgi:hypothetical protein
MYGALTQPFLLVAYVNLLEVPQVVYLGQILILALEEMNSGGVFLLTKGDTNTEFVLRSGITTDLTNCRAFRLHTTLKPAVKASRLREL